MEPKPPTGFQTHETTWPNQRFPHRNPNLGDIFLALISSHPQRVTSDSWRVKSHALHGGCSLDFAHQPVQSPEQLFQNLDIRERAQGDIWSPGCYFWG